MIIIENEEETRNKIEIEAKKLLKTPFRHRGRTTTGLDCLGFIWLVYKRSGLTDIPPGDGKIYNPQWFYFCTSERYLEGLLTYADYIDEPKKGDLVSFKMFENIVTHVGIIIDVEKKLFIHARSGKFVQMDSYDRKPYNRKFFRFLTYKGFIDKD